MCITTIKEVHTVRYFVELVRLVSPTLGVYYSVLTRHLGRNGRWYNSQFYEWTELTAERGFNRAVCKARKITTW